jgi:hypothetical protein
MYDVPLELLMVDVPLPVVPVAELVDPVVPDAVVPEVLEPLPIFAFCSTNRSVAVLELADVLLPLVALVPLVPVAPPIEPARCKQPVTVTVFWLELDDG